MHASLRREVITSRSMSPAISLAARQHEPACGAPIFPDVNICSQAVVAAHVAALPGVWGLLDKNQIKGYIGFILRKNTNVMDT